jgi:hypothetical protein
MKLYQCLKKALGKCKDLVGEEHPLTTALMGELSEAYIHENRMNDAKEMIDQSLQISRILFGADDTRIWYSKTYLVALY